METHDERKRFCDSHWPTVRAIAQTAGVEGVLDFIRGFDGERQRILFLYVRDGLLADAWEGRSLDLYHRVAAAGIEEFLARARRAIDENERRHHLEAANVLSYNLSADLADCWPGDEIHREPRHFEAGRAAAEDCIRWREDLRKGGSSRAMAHWAFGFHALRLGDLAVAEVNFTRSLEYSTAALESRDGGEDVGILLGSAYLGIAGWLRGTEQGRERFEAAIGRLREKAMASDEDAAFAVAQLERVVARCSATM